MKNFTYKMILSYNGTGYYGYQKQKQTKLITIQSVLEKSLFKLTKKPIKTFAASRTDKGVHAEGQVVHFSLSFFIFENVLKFNLNKILPESIKIIDIKLVNNNFHARYNSKSKIYKYVFSKKPLNPFNYCLKVYFDSIDFEKISKAICFCEGKHDFSLFTNNKDKNKSTIKKIYRSFLAETEENIFLFFHGKGF
ncbi:tRNA pseudouridine(38-40) synthase TruA [Texas Phoenix palm phytoplasma]|uniref:tRNA pseudouridine(38-40) synthase TruA n=1 Tax=Texas Phoenix palm phytoplasma TaxID=176709 RepID=UPI001FEF0DEC|nr:tRNA pseudouridine(38-40) synthase TruA [Texas Phoenix palm phytoplasma]